MIFDKFFSSFGGGGAFGSRVDYASQEYPVPELAELARSGQVSSFFSEMKVATFAGGCFWGLELAYQRIPGVSYTIVGYTQGSEIEPNYDQVCAG
jgi:peptide-methionine (S)-S-oxide reductase